MTPCPRPPTTRRRQFHDNVDTLNRMYPRLVISALALEGDEFSPLIVALASTMLKIQPSMVGLGA